MTKIEAASGTLIEFEALPFVIGTSGSPNNPDSLPNVLPFALFVDASTGLIRQAPCEMVSHFLAKAYRAGSMLGTPMDDRPPGKRYADSFLQFVTSQLNVEGSSILEIGAGNGYFLHRLKELGANAIGIEPGRSNREHWLKYNVDVINAFFPCLELNTKFDVVIGFGVLEHIEHLDQFLDGVRAAMRSKGVAIFAVPDCTRYIEDGDPGMLVHEHWNYFTASTLRASLFRAGFAVRSLEVSDYGGLLYVSAGLAKASTSALEVEQDIADALRFRTKCVNIRRCATDRVRRLKGAGASLGIYVPGRVLMWLETGPELTAGLRFFDDDSGVHGRFYPPFASAVESRDDLLREPVDEIWVMSKSFGEAIARELAEHQTLSGASILLVDDLLREFGDNP